MGGPDGSGPPIYYTVQANSLRIEVVIPHIGIFERVFAHIYVINTFYDASSSEVAF